MLGSQKLIAIGKASLYVRIPVSVEPPIPFEPFGEWFGMSSRVITGT